MAKAKAKALTADTAETAKPAPARNMRPSEIAALEILGRKIKGVRDDLAPGTYPVDMLLHVVGDVLVEENTETSESDKPDLKALLSLFLAEIPEEKREPFFQKLRKDHDSLGRFPLPTPLCDERITRLIADYTVTTKKPKRGSVRGTIAATIMPMP